MLNLRAFGAKVHSTILQVYPADAQVLLRKTLDVIAVNPFGI